MIFLSKNKGRTTPYPPPSQAGVQEIRRDAQFGRLGTQPKKVAKIAVNLDAQIGRLYEKEITITIS